MVKTGAPISFGGMIVIGLIFYALGGCDDEERPTRAKAGKMLPPLAELLIESKVKWVQTTAVILKMVGLVLQIEYFLSDGEKARITHELDEETSRSLKPGSKIMLRDADGVVRECMLVEVKPRTSPTPKAKPGVFFVRLQLNRSESRHLDEPAAARLLNKVSEIPGLPYWYRPIGFNRYEVRYGPLPYPQETMFFKQADAQAHANELRAAGFTVTIEAGGSGDGYARSL